MPLPAPELVRRVMEVLGCSGPTELARALDLDVHGYSRIYRWLHGENEPDYEATMLMLEKTGWLNLEARPPALPEAPVDGRLEALAEAASEILANQREALTLLHETLGRHETQSSEPPGQPRRRRS